MAVNSEGSTELLCRKKHTLSQCDAKGHKCNMCGRRCTEGDFSWYCEQCEYDVCENCELKAEIGKIILDCIEQKGEISEALKDYDKSDLEEFCNACFMNVRDITCRRSQRRNVGVWLKRMEQYIPQEEMPINDALHEIQQNFEKGVTKLEKVVSAMKTMVQPEFVANSKSVAEAFHETHIHLRNIKELETPKILVIGNASSGKSSLMNVFLGADVLKVGPKAGVTTTICEMIYSEEEPKVCTTTFECINEEFHIPTNSGDSLDKLLEPYTSATSGEENEVLRFKDIKVYGKFNILKSGLSLLDTPGLNDKGSFDEYIQKVVSSSLATIVVLPCGDACIPLNIQKIIKKVKTERTVFNPGSIFFVVTKSDKEIDAEETSILDGIRTSVKSLVGTDDFMFIVNLKEAIEVRQFGMQSPKHKKLLLGLVKFVESMLASYLRYVWKATSKTLSDCSIYVKYKLNQEGEPVKKMMSQCDLQKSTLQIVEEVLAKETSQLRDLQADEVNKFAIRLQEFFRRNKDILDGPIREYHPREVFESVDDQLVYISKTVLETVLKDISLHSAYADAQRRICDLTLALKAKIVEVARTVSKTMDSEFYSPLVQDVDGDETKEFAGGDSEASGGAEAANQRLFRTFMKLVDIAQIGPAATAMYASLGSSVVDESISSIGGIIVLIHSDAHTMKAPIHHFDNSHDVSGTLALAKLIVDETSCDENERATALSEQLFADIQKLVSEVILKIQKDISSMQEMLRNLWPSEIVKVDNLDVYHTWLEECISKLNDPKLDAWFAKRFG